MGFSGPHLDPTVTLTGFSAHSRTYLRFLAPIVTPKLITL